jgi:hypothetical protein
VSHLKGSPGKFQLVLSHFLGAVLGELGQKPLSLSLPPLIQPAAAMLKSLVDVVSSLGGGPPSRLHRSPLIPDMFRLRLVREPCVLVSLYSSLLVARYTMLLLLPQLLFCIAGEVCKCRRSGARKLTLCSLRHMECLQMPAWWPMIPYRSFSSTIFGSLSLSLYLSLYLIVFCLVV